MQHITGTVVAVEEVVPIDPVDVNKTVVLISTLPDSNNFLRFTVAAEITSSTEVTLIKDEPFQTPFALQVIEFEDAKSLQKGDMIISTQDIDISIDPIDPSKAILFYSFSYRASSGGAGDMFLFGQIKDGTTINFQQYQARNRRLKWQVIEFN